MAFRERVAAVRKRPGMFGLDGSYPAYVLFLRGCDFATEFALLRGFAGWLNRRIGEESSLDWPDLCLRLAFDVESGADTRRPATPAEHELAADTLFTLLDEFLTREMA
ncbi:hypothetical protein ACPZ19_15895 [Amycolatopsis lurida]